MYKHCLIIADRQTNPQTDRETQACHAEYFVCQVLLFIQADECLKLQSGTCFNEKTTSSEASRMVD